MMLNILSTKNHNDINFKKKPIFKSVQGNNGRNHVERKNIIEVTRALSQVMPIMRSTRTVNYHNMADKQNQGKQKTRYYLLINKIFKQIVSGSRGNLHNENNLVKLKESREEKHLLSIKKREAGSKNTETSEILLDQSILKSTKITSINISDYDLTTVQNIIMTEAHLNKDPVSSPTTQNHRVLDFPQKEIWFVSDEGSDENNCHTESTPCRNLQTVLDRALDDADIYVTSSTLSLALFNASFWDKLAFGKKSSMESCCMIHSNLSYALRSISGISTEIICSGRH